jgi:excisionase family DNA binding protein
MSIHEELGLVSGAEAAQYLGVSNAAMFSMKRSGVIPSVRLGRKIYYRKQDLYNHVVSSIHFNNGNPVEKPVVETADTEEN